ncbi:MAG: type 4a pilus biogenesis protein PilO [Armatimonadota bacterium]|nr:type 4a pilus biogenesis protein PilO [Armatimonadota bacterium]MDR7400803.1 type 4a pilus biogenesis protein PilO [Armatimonadota bacterium]MDR7404407.1 type 4a pilus biogenesis protein PilO [Armatimonadota bacterium]MDR7436604.1 type 4a pilus biogenesis protein PilO [Armatimonadota bacterium]MDR7472977.1 type 4a pilus biogenesis protein PilO [Armatimonadota bacterium]
MSPLRPRERTLLGAGAAVLAGVLLGGLLYLPALLDLTAARREVVRKSAELRRATALAQQRPEVESRYAAERRAAEQLLTRIPREPDLPDLIVRLDGALSGSGVELMEVTFPPETSSPASPAEPAPVSALPVQIRVRGRYPQVRALVEAIERSPRLLVIDRVMVTGAEAGVVAELQMRALYRR